MNIEVFQEDIESGFPRDQHSCPIAKALVRTGFEDVTVQKQFVWGNLDGGFYEFRLPRRARRFIKRFDGGKTVKPFQFKARLKAFEV